MNPVIKSIALQCKFLLVAWLNFSNSLIPNPIRHWYLLLFGIKLGPGSSIHRGCKFFHVGNMSIGRNSVINFGCYLDNRRGIVIGNNVGIAHDSKLYTLGHNIDSSFFETKGAPIVIEDDVFVFSNVLIMPGVTLHQGAVVLAGSVVTKDVGRMEIVGGNPAKVIRKRNIHVDYKMNYNYWFAL